MENGRGWRQEGSHCYPLRAGGERQWVERDSRGRAPRTRWTRETGHPGLCPELVWGWLCRGRTWLLPDRQLGAGVRAEDGVSASSALGKVPGNGWGEAATPRAPELDAAQKEPQGQEEGSKMCRGCAHPGVMLEVREEHSHGKSRGTWLGWAGGPGEAGGDWLGAPRWCGCVRVWACSSLHPALARVPRHRGLGPYTDLQEVTRPQGRTAEPRGRGCTETQDRLGVRKKEGRVKTEQSK